MPRNLNLGASTLRNRNRVTNKTRLRIVIGNIDADPLVLDEDEEKARVISTAGVDAEDANEHHLQAVLSAASQRHQVSNARTTRNGTTVQIGTPPAYIPTPDSTGIVDNYMELYPPARWTDPATYIRTSETVDVYLENGLNDRFTYFMDERDKEWLDRNNEEARGEGTSAQGAVLSSSATTRSSSLARSAKAKGKEPDVAQPVTIAEDEFELVMGLFEKITQEKTPFLHHAVEDGQPFPAFSDYSEAFAQPLPPSQFTYYAVPSWMPQGPQLVKIARAIYPWWKERRTERGGHRIIPTLNYNEADVANESYICFRHREIKAVRKTRAQQTTPSDKVLRLRHEMTGALDVAAALLRREELKRDVSQQSRTVWNQRLPLLELKRNFSSLDAKEDEELLVDRELVVKKPRHESKLPLKITRNVLGNEAASTADSIKPRERFMRIQSQIEKELQCHKERDHHWEDQIDNVSQPLPLPYHHRLFKYLPAEDPPIWPAAVLDPPTEDSRLCRPSRALRLRFGRGGRLLVDRCDARLRLHASQKSFSRNWNIESGGGRGSPCVDSHVLDESIWKYDLDDVPAASPWAAEEQDRVLIDDFEAKYMRHTMTLLDDQDSAVLMTDPTIVIHSMEGHAQKTIPFRLGGIHVGNRREAASRTYPAGHVASLTSSVTQAGASAQLPAQSPATSVPSPLKKLPSLVAHPPLRISSNGGLRPPNPQATLLHPPQAGVLTTTGVNAPVSRSTDADTTPNGNVAAQSQAEAPSDDVITTNSKSKSQDQPHVVNMTNGYHLPQLNGYPMIANGTAYSHHNPNALSAAQLSHLKTTFTGSDMSTALQGSGGRLAPPYVNHLAQSAAAFNMQHVLGSGVNLKVPGPRPMLWPSTSSPQRPMTASGLDVTGLNGRMSPSPNLVQTGPIRSPSANGVRSALRGGVSAVNHVMGQPPGVQLSHSMSPRLHHSPPPLPQVLAQVSTSPRPPQTPVMMPSPSVQHQQAIGTQGAY